MLGCSYKEMCELIDRQSLALHIPSHDHGCDHARLAQKPKMQRRPHCLCIHPPGHQHCARHVDSSSVLG